MLKNFQSEGSSREPKNRLKFKVVTCLMAIGYDDCGLGLDCLDGRIVHFVVHRLKLPVCVVTLRHDFDVHVTVHRDKFL